MIDDWFWDGGSLQLDPNNPNTLWACGNTTGPDRFAVARSTNGGVSWTRWFPLGAASGNTGAEAMALHPTSSNTAWVAGYDSNGLQIMKTTNGGSSWSNLNSTGLGGDQFTDMVIDPGNHQILYAGTNTGVYKSTNGAQSFQKVSNFTSVMDLLINPQDNTEIYAATNNAGVFVSNNSGSSWSNMSWGLGSAKVYMLAIDTENDFLYAGTEGNSHYRFNLYTSIEDDLYEPIEPASQTLSVSGNPCVSSATVNFNLASSQHASIAIYNIAGRVVERVESGYFQRGQHSIHWNRGQLPAGVYLVSLQSEQTTLSTRMILL